MLSWLSIFSPREKATVAWILILAIAAIARPASRRHVVDIIKIACFPRLLIPVLLFCAYIFAVLHRLGSLGFEGPELLKSGITWLAAGGMPLIYSATQAGQGEGFWRDTMRGQFRIIVVLEFIAASYTFGFLLEFIFIPFLVLMITVDTVIGIKPEFARLRKGSASMMTVVGFGLIVAVLASLIRDPTPIFSFQALREFLVEPFLLLAAIPAVYFMMLAEEFLIFRDRMSDYGRKSRMGSAWSVTRVFWACRFSLRALRQFSRKHNMLLVGIEPERLDQLLCGESVSANPSGS
jgi:hypothetical protein